MSYTIAISNVDTPLSSSPTGLFSSEIYISSRHEEPLKMMNFEARRVTGMPRAEGPPRVKRRLRGFFVQEEGTEARVAFVEGDHLVHYYLPLRLLQDGGVTTENQPFELDEFEEVIRGVRMRGYSIRAAARPQDSYPDQLPLDERAKENLRFLLAHPANAAR